MGFIDAAFDALIGRKPKPFSTMGTGGTYSIGGFLQSNEVNAQLGGPYERLKKFDDISLNVGIVATGIRYYGALLAGVGWTPEPPEEGGDEAKKIADLIDKIMHGMDTPFYKVVRRMGQFKWVGHSVQEWIAGRKDDIKPGLIGYASIENRSQSTLEQWSLEEQSNYVDGWMQRDHGTGQLFPLSRAKCIYIFDDTLTDSPDGVGLMRHVVTLVQQLRKLEQLEGWTFETDLRGVPVAYMPTGLLDEMVSKGFLTRDEANLKTKGLNDFVKNHLKNPQLGVALDSSVYTTQDNVRTPSQAKMWGLELLKGDGKGLAELGTSIERKNREIARVLGIEQFLLGDGKGSHALSDDKSSNLVQIISSSVAEIAWTLEHDFLDPLFALNKWNPKLKPKLKPDAVHLRSVEGICDALQKLSMAGGTILPNDPVINQIRGMLQLVDQPELTPEQLGVMSGTALPKDPNTPPPAPGDKPGLPGQKTPGAKPGLPGAKDEGQSKRQENADKITPKKEA